MRIQSKLFILSLAIGFLNQSLALEKIIEPNVSYDKFAAIPTETQFFNSVLEVSANRGVVSGAYANIAYSGHALDPSSLTIVKRNGLVSICHLENVCTTVGLSLESAVRIGHWVASGKWRAFTCIPNENNFGTQKTLITRDGMVSIGESTTTSCGIRFIAGSLNGEELIELFKRIDFGYKFIDRQHCRSPKQINVSRNVTNSYPLATEDGSWVNMDLDKVPMVILGDNDGISRPLPERYWWVREENKKPYVTRICEAAINRDLAQKKALEFFRVAASFRAIARSNFSTLQEFVNLHVHDYE